MEIYRIGPNESEISKLAKMAAVISEFAIQNPLHVAFEDGNLEPYDDMADEMMWNEYSLKKNGPKMYKYIKDFLKRFAVLSAEDQKACYRLYHKKLSYLNKKMIKRINVKNVKGGFGYRQYMENGTIIIEDTEGNIAYTF